MKWNVCGKERHKVIRPNRIERTDKKHTPQSSTDTHIYIWATDHAYANVRDLATKLRTAFGDMLHSLCGSALIQSTRCIHKQESMICFCATFAIPPSLCMVCFILFNRHLIGEPCVCVYTFGMVNTHVAFLTNFHSSHSLSGRTEWERSYNIHFGASTCFDHLFIHNPFLCVCEVTALLCVFSVLIPWKMHLIILSFPLIHIQTQHTHTLSHTMANETRTHAFSWNSRSCWDQRTHIHEKNI